MHRRVAAILAITALLGASCSHGDTVAAPGATVAEGFPLKVVEDLPLPGNTARLDYQDLDPEAHRLYIAHRGGPRRPIIRLG